MDSTVQHKKKNSLDVVFTTVMFAVFGLVLVSSYSLSRTAGSVPKIIGACGMILSVVSLLVKGKAKAARTVVKDESDAAEEPKAAGMSFWTISGLIVLYFALMVLFGFALSTLAMLALLPVAMGYRHYVTNIIFSVITTAILYFSFVKLFYVRLPNGLIIDLIFKAV